MNQAEYLDRVRKRKKAAVGIIYPDDVPSTTRNPLTVRDRVANYLDPTGHGSSGDFHTRKTKHKKDANTRQRSGKHVQRHAGRARD